MEFHKCYVCGSLLRAYGKKTCGGKDCIASWKSWPAATKHQAILLTDKGLNAQLEYLKDNVSKVTDDSPLSAEDQLSILNAPPEEQNFLSKILSKEKGDDN